MEGQEEFTAEVTITNPLGFHVRPVQRFAELARMFQAEVEVELRGRTVPGKSVINLMSCGGRHGDKMIIRARSKDAQQCVSVLRLLAEEEFFVEDSLPPGSRPNRHVERLAGMASCFRSRITATLNGKSADAKNYRALLKLGLTPTSEPSFEIVGEDADQARAVLNHLVRHRFFIEDQMADRRRRPG